MTNPQKKLSEYLNKSMRKLKHRKGYGVHSPFAYSVITEVIEEKLPYYAYHRMARTYGKQAPIPHKVACLLLRLANRFRCRNAAVLGCDGGYSLLPLLLSDSRLQAVSLGTPESQQQLAINLSWLPTQLQHIAHCSHINELDSSNPFDFIIINKNPFPTDAQLVDWVMSHSKDDTLVWVKGILIKRPMEQFWDLLCDRDDVSITMDLYDFGLAILRPKFFKQHYIVSF